MEKLKLALLSYADETKPTLAVYPNSLSIPNPNLCYLSDTEVKT